MNHMVGGKATDIRSYQGTARRWESRSFPSLATFRKWRFCRRVSTCRRAIGKRYATFGELTTHNAVEMSARSIRPPVGFRFAPTPWHIAALA